MSSIEKNNFNNNFVLDERWERFPTNQNGDEDFLQILKTEEANVDFSIRIYDDRSSEVLNKKRVQLNWFIYYLLELATGSTKCVYF